MKDERSRLRQAAALLALLLVPLCSAAEPRQPSVPDEELIAVELATVAVVPMAGTPVVLLREPESGDVVPIFVGPAEARAIMFALSEVEVPRPMTHDLMLDLVHATGASIERVVVDDLRDGTYYGLLELRQEGSEAPIWVDTRPSDGLALALRAGARIEVAPKVLEAARGMPYEGLPSDQVVTAVGITVVEATEELRAALDLPDDEGVLVSGVTGAAEASGMRSGSLVLSVNGERPSMPMDFLDLVRGTEAGEKAIIEYWQDGRRRELELSTEVPRRAPRALPGQAL
jgi:bifunctional DNase/RNase